MQEVPDQLKPVLERVRRDFRAADSFHKQYRDRWDYADRLYHNFRDLQQSHTKDSDVDQFTDARREFGHELFIPFAFTTIEEAVPQQLANRPRPMVMPGPSLNFEELGGVLESCERMKWLIDFQAQRNTVELPLQTVTKCGDKFGIGIAKTGWRSTGLSRRVVLPSVGTQYEWQLGQTTDAWDDAYVEAVDPRNFLWDPFGYSLETCRYVIHRTWRPTRYVLEKLGLKGTPRRNPDGSPAPPEWPLQPLTPEDLKTSGSKNEWDTLYRERHTAQQMAELNIDSDDVHEVWEHHDGERVVIVLNRKWVVAIGDNLRDNIRPKGGYPFHVFSPTEVEFRMVGKSLLEPIEDLQLELNMLRTDRRWNALLKMHTANAYDRDNVDPHEFGKIGPGTLHPVQGDPSRVLSPLISGDIPNSGYQEEQAMKQDLQMVAGLLDPANSPDGTDTATGMQLWQAAVSHRVRLQTFRIEKMLCKSIGQEWLYLNQQHITQARAIPKPAAPTLEEPERAWEWIKVGPGEIAGSMSFDVEGGSTSPQNEAANMQKANALLQVQQSTAIDTPKMMLLILDLLGVRQPQAYMAQQAPHVDAQKTAEKLVNAGVDPGLVDAAIAATLREAGGQ